MDAVHIRNLARDPVARVARKLRPGNKTGFILSNGTRIRRKGRRKTEISGREALDNQELIADGINDGWIEVTDTTGQVLSMEDFQSRCSGTPPDSADEGRALLDEAEAAEETLTIEADTVELAGDDKPVVDGEKLEEALDTLAEETQPIEDRQEPSEALPDPGAAELHVDSVPEPDWEAAEFTPEPEAQDYEAKDFPSVEDDAELKGPYDKETEATDGELFEEAPAEAPAISFEEFLGDHEETTEPEVSQPVVEEPEAVEEQKKASWTLEELQGLVRSDLVKLAQEAEIPTKKVRKNRLIELLLAKGQET
jgi:hypothetical protein